MASQAVKDLLDRMVDHPGTTTENVIYRPKGGKDRQITVLVDRQGSDSIGGPTRPVMTVTALNDRLDGIAAAEINRGGDKVMLPEKFADLGPLDRTVNRTSFQDQDWIMVEIG